MNLRSRSYQPEILDGDSIPEDDIWQNMKELDRINSLLGGHATTVSGLKSLLQNNGKINKEKEIIICEIGCGGGDNIRELNKWMLKKNLNAKFIGIDINPSCITFAKNNCLLGNVTWLISDYTKIRFDKKPHIIFCSLFCHHFNNDELIKMFEWLQQNSGCGYFINDLHRHAFAYYSIKFFTSLFSNSYLVRNDAPLSVARGFKKKELVQLLKAGKIESFKIHWKWAFRWIITVDQ